jgi:thiamine-monophosphate kinase
MTSTVRTDTQTIASVGERALIARIRDRLAPGPEWLLIGPGDDAAVIARERNALDVLTTDACVEGVHFDRRFVPPRAIGHRALAVNLSDLAAMGAQPRLFLLSMMLPPTLAMADFDDLVSGLLELAAHHRIVLAGGNIARSPGPLMLDVTAFGSVRPRRVMTRNGARPGDFVFVSGTVGDGRAGLQMCRMSSDQRGMDSASVRSRYVWPEARVRLGLLLGRQQAATACMDLSDGLADGLHRLAESSQVGVEIDAEALPIDPHTRAWFAAHGEDPIVQAVAGGDDFELLFTVSPRRQGRLRAVTRGVKSPVLTRIGTVTRETDVVLRRGTRRELLPEGFQHFGSSQGSP